MLATSAEARQLVDELRALRTSLQELPQHSLELEFAQRVLDRAQRELNAERIALVAAETESHDGAAVTEQPSIHPAAVDAALSAGPKIALAADPTLSTLVRSALFNRRGLSWSFVALAVALMVMVATKQQPERNPAAVGQANADKVAGAVRGLSTPTNQPQISPARPADRDLAANAPEPGQSERFDTYRSPAAKPTPHAENNLEKEVAGGDPLSASRQPPEARLADSFAIDSKLSAANTWNDKSDATGKLGAMQSQSAAEQNGLLVVQVSLTPEAAQNGEFEKLLAKHHIAMSDSAMPQEGLLRKLERDLPTLADRPASAWQTNRDASDRRNATQADAEKRPQELAGDRSQDYFHRFNFQTPPGAEPAELVYVEASQEQLDGALRNLQELPSDFAVTMQRSAVDETIRLEQADSLRAKLATNPAEELPRYGRAAARGGRGGAKAFGMNENQADAGRERFAGGGGANANRSYGNGAGGGGFGGGAAAAGGGALGRASALAPANPNESAAANASDVVELKKADELKDTESAKSRIAPLKAGSTRLTQKNDNVDAPKQQSAELGRARRMTLPEAQRQLSLGLETAESNGGAVPADRPGPMGQTGASGAPAPGVAADKMAESSELDSQQSRRPVPESATSKTAVDDLTLKMKIAPTAPSATLNGRQSLQAPAAPPATFRALFVLQVVDKAAAEKPAAATVPPAATGKP